MDRCRTHAYSWAVVVSRIAKRNVENITRSFFLTTHSEFKNLRFSANILLFSRNYKVISQQVYTSTMGVILVESAKLEVPLPIWPADIYHIIPCS